MVVVEDESEVVMIGIAKERCIGKTHRNEVISFFDIPIGFCKSGKPKYYCTIHIIIRNIWGLFYENGEMTEKPTLALSIFGNIDHQHNSGFRTTVRCKSCVDAIVSPEYMTNPDTLQARVVKSIVSVWKKYNLNNRHWGTTMQEELLKQWKKDHSNTMCRNRYSDFEANCGHCWYVQTLPAWIENWYYAVEKLVDVYANECPRMTNENDKLKRYLDHWENIS